MQVECREGLRSCELEFFVVRLARFCWRASDSESSAHLQLIPGSSLVGPELCASWMSRRLTIM